MDLITHFKMLAHYNRLANERLYEGCSQLDREDYRKPRQVSFGSIHALLNHLLLGDRIWMARFKGAGQNTPPLNAVQFEEFSELRSARIKEDLGIEEFFAKMNPDFLTRLLPYINNQGRSYTEEATVAISHFFNHQTHHRGQVHAMLSQTSVKPPSLDLHRIINP